MSEHPEDTLQTDELEAQVAELLRQIDEQAEAVESRMRGGDDDGAAALAPGQAIGDAGADAAVRDLDDQVERLIEEANGPSDEALDEAVDDLIEAAQPEGAEDEPEATAADPAETAPAQGVAAGEAAPPDEPEASEAALDEETAVPEERATEPASPTDATDEALDDEELGAPASGPESATAPEASDELDEALAAEADATLEGAIEEVDLGETDPEPAFGDDSELPEDLAAPAVREKPVPSPEGEAAGAAAAETGTAKPARPGLLARLVAFAVGLLHALSRPLDRLTPRQRDTVGWIALNALFIAVCVWLVLLLR